MGKSNVFKIKIKGDVYDVGMKDVTGKGPLTPVLDALYKKIEKETNLCIYCNPLGYIVEEILKKYPGVIISRATPPRRITEEDRKHGLIA
jgi:hypothetical protein